MAADRLKPDFETSSKSAGRKVEMLLEHPLYPCNVGRSAAFDHLDADDDGFPVELAFDDDVDLALDAQHLVNEELGLCNGNSRAGKLLAYEVHDRLEGR